MDFIKDVVINLLFHRVGVRARGFLSGGRFKEERSFAWGVAVAIAGLVLLALFASLITWIIHTGER